MISKRIKTERQPLSSSLAILYRDAQERATRVLETGATAARHVVIASAYSALERKERAS
jgi:hypothetical protein